jgi:hypothetical protein
MLILALLCADAFKNVCPGANINDAMSWSQKGKKISSPRVLNKASLHLIFFH